MALRYDQRAQRKRRTLNPLIDNIIVGLSQILRGGFLSRHWWGVGKENCPAYGGRKEINSPLGTASFQIILEGFHTRTPGIIRQPKKILKINLQFDERET